MNEISLLAAIFQGIPESIALFFIILVLLRSEVNWKIILILGILNTIFMYFFRSLPLAFGIHTVLLVIISFFMLKYITGYGIIKIIPPIIIAFTLLISYEFFFYYLYCKILGLNMEVIWGNDLFRIISGIPHIILLFLTGAIILFIRKEKKILKRTKGYEYICF